MSNITEEWPLFDWGIEAANYLKLQRVSYINTPLEGVLTINDAREIIYSYLFLHNNVHMNCFHHMKIPANVVKDYILEQDALYANENSINFNREERENELQKILNNNHDNTGLITYNANDFIYSNVRNVREGLDIQSLDKDEIFYALGDGTYNSYYTNFVEYIKNQLIQGTADKNITDFFNTIIFNSIYRTNWDFNNFKRLIKCVEEGTYKYTLDTKSIHPFYNSAENSISYYLNEISPQPEFMHITHHRYLDFMNNTNNFRNNVMLEIAYNILLSYSTRFWGKVKMNNDDFNNPLNVRKAKNDVLLFLEYYYENLQQGDNSHNSENMWNNDYRIHNNESDESINNKGITVNMWMPLKNFKHNSYRLISANTITPWILSAPSIVEWYKNITFYCTPEHFNQIELEFHFFNSSIPSMIVESYLSSLINKIEAIMKNDFYTMVNNELDEELYTFLTNIHTIENSYRFSNIHDQNHNDSHHYNYKITNIEEDSVKWTNNDKYNIVASGHIFLNKIQDLSLMKNQMRKNFSNTEDYPFAHYNGELDHNGECVLQYLINNPFYSRDYRDRDGEFIIYDEIPQEKNSNLSGYYILPTSFYTHKSYNNTSSYNEFYSYSLDFYCFMLSQCGIPYREDIYNAYNELKEYTESLFDFSIFREMMDIFETTDESDENLNQTSIMKLSEISIIIISYLYKNILIMSEDDNNQIMPFSWMINTSNHADQLMHEVEELTPLIKEAINKLYDDTF